MPSNQRFGRRWVGIAAPVLIAGLLVCAAEAILTLLGVEPIAQDQDPYVGFTSYLPLFVDGVDEDGIPIKKTAENKVRYFNSQQFLAKKPDNGSRIFCLGGSTTYGHPYDDATSFVGWLRAFLPKADPSRHWEVVNCGGISYASYRLALLMEELCAYEPNLFIVYTGHNEFLERRTYEDISDASTAEKGIGTALAKTRLYSVIKRTMDAPPDVSPERLLPAEVDTILDNSVGPDAYHRDDLYRGMVQDHFRFNLDRMTRQARDAGAEVLFIAPVSNLRDCSPFKSEPTDGLTTDDYEYLVANLDRSRKLLHQHKYADALVAADDALAIDSRYPDAHYRRGRALWRLGEFEPARRAFERARDEDICPLRATTPLIDAIRGTAADNEALLVDFVELVDTWSEHGTPGDDWFLDHVHPTIEGHERLALAIVDRLIDGRVVDPVQAWGPDAQAEVEAQVEGAIDTVAHGRALLTVAQVYMWGGKYEEARTAAERARKLSPDDWMVYYVLACWGRITGNLDEAISFQRQAIERNPDDELLQRQWDELLEMRGETDPGIPPSRE